VETGTAVQVWNSRGEVRAVCSVSNRVRPGVAWMPFGGLTDAGGAKRSVNVLTAEEPTDWGGGSGLYDAFVEIAPAGPQDSAFASPQRDDDLARSGSRFAAGYDTGP
jgi:anaerobic selenocysteine-containing dehydrogenase